MSRHRTTVLSRLQALFVTTVLLASTAVALAASPARAANNPAATVPCGTPATTTATLRAAIVACAKAQLGGGSARVAESPAGSNCNPYASALGRGSSYSGIAKATCPSGTRYDEWCADTSDWIWLNALPGTTMAAKEAQIPGWSTLTATAASFKTWATQQGTWHAYGSYTPVAGDAVVWGGNGHVGIVTSVGTGGVITVVAGNGGPTITTAFGGQNVEVFQESRAMSGWTANGGSIVGFASPKTTLPTGTANQSPVGSLDSAVSAPTEIEVGGWAYDPDSTAAINVDVYVDGTYRTRVFANGYRPDVPYGAYHGYDVGVGGIAPGSHQACAYAIDSAGGPNPQLGCKNVTVLTGNPFGNFDNFSVGANHSVVLNGWAIDPDTTAGINVDIWYDSNTKYGGRFVANTIRTDVGAAYPGYGTGHGFSIGLTLPAGTHTVCAFGINTGPGTTNPQLGTCKTITA